jgi:hypothetical protein
VGTTGKRIITDRVEKIRNDVEQFYGELNELRMGARGTPPVKPDILVLYETLKESGLPIVAGGYVDQPFLTTLYLEAAGEMARTMEYLNSLANRPATQ